MPGTSGVRADEELRSRIKTTLQEHQEHFRSELGRTSIEKQRLKVQNPENAARHALKPGFLLSDYILLSIL